jgi:hypothetical protein
MKSRQRVLVRNSKHLWVNIVYPNTERGDSDVLFHAAGSSRRLGNYLGLSRLSVRPGSIHKARLDGKGECGT